MAACFVGRGALLISVVGGTEGYFQVSGQSEVTVDLREDNESINDARNGSVERVDWYVRNYRVTVNAECFSIDEDAIELLLKAKRTNEAAGSGIFELPSPLSEGRFYPTSPGMTVVGLLLKDAIGTVVDSSKYTVQVPYGLVSINDKAGYVEPFEVHGSWGAFSSLALNAKSQTLVSAILRGVNKVTGQEVMAEFYRLALDVSEEWKLVQKGFSSLGVRLQAVPDVSQPLDDVLGQYGRIILL